MGKKRKKKVMPSYIIVGRGKRLPPPDQFGRLSALEIADNMVRMGKLWNQFTYHLEEAGLLDKVTQEEPHADNN